MEQAFAEKGRALTVAEVVLASLSVHLRGKFMEVMQSVSTPEEFERALATEPELRAALEGLLGIALQVMAQSDHRVAAIVRKLRQIPFLWEAVSAESPIERARLIAQHPELCESATLTTLDELSATACQQDLTEIADLLARTKEILSQVDAIEATRALAEMPPELVETLPRRVQGVEMPDRIQLLRHELDQMKQKDNPVLWATLHESLAHALMQAPDINRAENIEEAIQHHELALQVYERDTHPDMWALAQANLGSAYLQRIRGNRTENMEAAIYHCEQALQVFTRENYPEQWADIQMNLAIAYKEQTK